MDKRCVDCNKKVSFYAKRCNSCANKGEKNFNFGKKFTNSHKEKLSLAQKQKCGELNQSYKDGRTFIKHYCKEKNCNNEISYRAWYCCSGRCRSCSCKQRLKDPRNHPSYIDGKSKRGYPHEFNNFLRENIKKRDDYKCRNCGMTQEEHYIVYGRDLEVHHIDYNRKNCKEINLITLCKQDNIRANFNRDYWKNFYRSKMKDLK